MMLHYLKCNALMSNYNQPLSSKVSVHFWAKMFLIGNSCTIQVLMLSFYYLSKLLLLIFIYSIIVSHICILYYTLSTYCLTIQILLINLGMHFREVVDGQSELRVVYRLRRAHIIHSQGQTTLSLHLWIILLALITITYLSSPVRSGGGVTAGFSNFLLVLMGSSSGCMLFYHGKMYALVCVFHKTSVTLTIFNVVQMCLQQFTNG